MVMYVTLKSCSHSHCTESISNLLSLICKMADQKSRQFTSTRCKVERMSDIPNAPTLSYYTDNYKSIQHPIVYQIFHPILKSKSNTSGDCKSIKGILNNQ
eukprot:NODE_782_length_3919_cov_0.611518.p5 type:complete len:100 gc:universal NODE_782_length_3919_cov_0.611518:2757-2458(-)